MKGREGTGEYRTGARIQARKKGDFQGWGDYTREKGAIQRKTENKNNHFTRVKNKTESSETRKNTQTNLAMNIPTSPTDQL